MAVPQQESKDTGLIEVMHETIPGPHRLKSQAFPNTGPGLPHVWDLSVFATDVCACTASSDWEDRNSQSRFATDRSFGGGGGIELCHSRTAIRCAGFF